MNPLAKVYDCDAKGCAGNATHILFLKSYENHKFFSCSHCLPDIRNRLLVFALAFKVDLQVEPIKDIIFKL